MLSRDIAMYSKLRYEIRAYMNFIFEQNIKNYMPNMSINQVQNGMIRIHNEIKMFNALYILDENGILLDGISNKKQIDEFVNSLDGIVTEAGGMVDTMNDVTEKLDAASKAFDPIIESLNNLKSKLSFF